jgi:alcohol dehydrogenase class IV
VAATINLPRVLRVGAGASGQLVATLAELGLARPLLVTDPFMLACGYCARLQAPLDAAGIAYGLFSDCVPDPTTDSVYAALALLRAGEYDCVVALGGGSSLDTAKAVAVLAKHGGLMREYKVPRQIDSGLPPRQVRVPRPRAWR